MFAPNVNSSVYDAGYERVKSLFDEKQLSQFISYIFSVDKKEEKIGPVLLTKIANVCDDRFDLYDTSNHKNFITEVIIIVLKK